MSIITLLIVDDHQIIRDGIRYYFGQDDEFIIKGEAENGVEALEMLEANTYDLILTDIHMPKMDGIELVKNVREQYPEQKVLMLSMYNEAGYINKAIALGANGYLLKKSDKEELVRAMKKVVEGKDHFSEEVYQTIICNIAGKKTTERIGLPAELSRREKEILQLIAGEYSNQEMADELFISVRTIEKHKQNLLEKTNSKNVAGLVMYSVEHNLV